MTDIPKSATKLCVCLRVIRQSSGRRPEKIDADKETPVAITTTAVNMRKTSATFALWRYFVTHTVNRVSFTVNGENNNFYSYPILVYPFVG